MERVTSQSSVNEYPFIAGIDLGTKTITAIAGTQLPGGKVRVEGMVTESSDGIKRGVISNLDMVVVLIRKVVKDLEKKTGKKISGLYCSTGGNPLRVKKNRVSRLLAENEPVTSDLIRQMEEENNKVGFDRDTKVLSVSPVRFLIDNDTVNNPIGAVGSRIETEYLLVGCKHTSCDRIESAIVKAGYKCMGIIPAPIASAVSVVNDEEKRVGTVVVDMGAGSSSLAIFQNGRLQHVFVIPLGGDAITNDIQIAWNMLPAMAEKTKITHGVAVPDIADENTILAISSTKGWPGKEIPVKTLSFVIEARLEEILKNIVYQIDRVGLYDKIGAGIVLTGGASDMEALTTCVEKNTGIAARLGNLLPVYSGGAYTREISNSASMRAVGLVVLGRKNCIEIVEEVSKPEVVTPIQTAQSVSPSAQPAAKHTSKDSKKSGSKIGNFMDSLFSNSNTDDVEL